MLAKIGFFSFYVLFVFIIYSVCFASSQRVLTKRLRHVSERNLMSYNDISDLDIQFLHDTYKMALKNKHVIFFGDSVTRYQYVSLIYFLKYKQFVNDTQRPNPLWERDFKDFNDYYAYTYQLLKPAWCDCDRGKGFSTENRYYYEPNMNIRITFIQYWEIYCEGHWSDYSDFDMFRIPEAPRADFWQLELNKCFSWAKNLYIREAHPEALNSKAFNNITKGFQTIGILNQGHHPHSFNNVSFAAKVAHDGVATFDKFVWKTTTGRKSGNEESYYAHDTLMCSFPGVICYNTSWTKRLNGSNFYDNLHFIPSVYKLLDIQLLKGLYSDSSNF